MGLLIALWGGRIRMRAAGARSREVSAGSRGAERRRYSESLIITSRGPGSAARLCRVWLDEGVRFLKGWFCDTLPKVPMQKLALTRIEFRQGQKISGPLTPVESKCVIGGGETKEEKGPFMDQAEIYNRLTKVFADVLDDDSIQVTPELSAKDVEGWDSLTHIRLLLTIEKAFRIKFLTSEIAKLKNVGNLAALIQSKV